MAVMGKKAWSQVETVIRQQTNMTSEHKQTVTTGADIKLVTERTDGEDGPRHNFKTLNISFHIRSLFAQK